jgi:hypothetical protein
MRLLGLLQDAYNAGLPAGDAAPAGNLTKIIAKE